MDSESAFHASGVSLTDSLKKSDPQDQAELDPVQQLLSEWASVTDGAVSETEQAEATTGRL